jgi:uncharacterized protein (TIGR02246 family)
MIRHLLKLPAVGAMLVALVLTTVPQGSPAAGGGKAKGGAEQDAIKARTHALMEAVSTGDAKALAEFWTPSGEYSREELTIRGRANIEKAYAAMFKDKKKARSLVVEDDTVRFLSDDAAIHEGTFLNKQTNPAEQGRSQFSALYLRVKGQWQLGLLRETPTESSARDLGWLVGTWGCKTEGGNVRLVFTWAEGKAFLRGRATVKAGDHTTTGYQIIGRDPANGGLRSWTFEEDGGTSEGLWERTEKGWTAKVSGYNSDGEKVTATTTMTPRDADTFTWHSTHRTVNGEKAPDIGPFEVTREKAK